MLVLTRKIGEKIVIGGNITVTILDGGRGDGVRIGIEAPRDVAIHRSEVVDAVSATNRRAVESTLGGFDGGSEQLILAALGLPPVAPEGPEAPAEGPSEVPPSGLTSPSLTSPTEP